MSSIAPGPQDSKPSATRPGEPSEPRTIQPSASAVRQMAILGNVCVGKTSLFDRLCLSSAHSVNIPGSTFKVSWGVLAVGPGKVARPVRRQCASCGASSARKQGLDSSRGPCHLETGMGAKCPVTLAEDLSSPVVSHLYDTPGSATLAANSEDEIVARDLILSGRLDSVLIVADAKNLRRSLALALEVAEFGLPMVLDLNMLDEAESLGIDLDDAVLTREMGVPVGRTVAIEKRGVRRLAELLLDARVPKQRTRFPKAVEEALERLRELLMNPLIAPRALGILLLSGDKGTETWVARQMGEQVLIRAQAIVSHAQSSFNTSLKGLIADTFYGAAERITDRVITSTTQSPSLLVRFGHLAQRPLSGALIGIGVLILTYYWVGAFGATFVVDNLAYYVFDGFLIPLFEKIIAPIPSAFVRDAIIDPDFGLLPSGLFLAVGIVLPILFCFYLLQAVLEDSGYLPRLAVLFDRYLRWLGLNGQGLIPLILGFSCITMAVITTRMLPTRKERIILTLLLILGIPCAPLLAVMMVILGKMSWTASFLIFAVITTQITVAGYVAAKVISGRLPDLILEIPKMRIPRPTIVLVKTWRCTLAFMREAVPIFLIASFAVFLFDRAGGLATIEEISRPLMQGLLGLPDEAVQVFIKTAIRRENGATELNLLRDKFDNVQLVVTMLVMTFLMPCINAIIVIIKERGLKVSMAILCIVPIWALAVGAIVNFACRNLGVTF